MHKTILKSMILGMDYFARANLSFRCTTRPNDAGDPFKSHWLLGHSCYPGVSHCLKLPPYYSHFHAAHTIETHQRGRTRGKRTRCAKTISTFEYTRKRIREKGKLCDWHSQDGQQYYRGKHQSHFHQVAYGKSHRSFLL